MIIRREWAASAGECVAYAGCCGSQVHSNVVCAPSATYEQHPQSTSYMWA